MLLLTIALKHFEGVKNRKIILNKKRRLRVYISAIRSIGDELNR